MRRGPSVVIVFFNADVGINEVPAAAACGDPHDRQDECSKGCRQQVSRRKTFAKAIMISGRIRHEDGARGSVLSRAMQVTGVLALNRCHPSSIMSLIKSAPVQGRSSLGL